MNRTDRDYLYYHSCCWNECKVHKEECVFHGEVHDMGATIHTCHFQKFGADFDCGGCKLFIERDEAMKLLEELAFKKVNRNK